MTSNRFFVRKNQIRASEVTLEGEEHHHLSRVARIKPRSRVWLFDEEGGTYLAQVKQVVEKRTHLVILEQVPARDRSRSQTISLAVSLLKLKGLEWILRKGTEVGMEKFIPVKTARSIVKIQEGTDEKKMQRWARITREAAKQSGRSRTPEILPVVSLPVFLQEPAPGLRLFLHEDAEFKLRDVALERFHGVRSGQNAKDDVLVLVGPEGGWTKGEADDILEHGFQAVSLGESILRAETAAISSLVILNQFWE